MKVKLLYIQANWDRVTRPSFWINLFWTMSSDWVRVRSDNRDRSGGGVECSARSTSHRVPVSTESGTEQFLEGERIAAHANLQHFESHRSQIEVFFLAAWSTHSEFRLDRVVKIHDLFAKSFWI